MPYPWSNSGPMPHAPRGGGNLNVNGGGGVVKPKPLPYDHPKTRSGPTDTRPGKGTNHGSCGTQGKY